MAGARAALAVLLLALLVLLVPVPVVGVDAPSPPQDGELVRVIDVTDGDTIRVEWPDGWWERVRYIGIDTPELIHEAGQADEPWAREATELNRDLVGSRQVLLERDISDTDRYDRLLRYVWVETDEGWVMVNGELVAAGLAEVRAYEPDTRHDAWFRRLRDEARDAGVGMYGDAGDDGEGADDDGLLERLLELIGWD
jgi:micrococcal nuclease